MNNAYGGMQRSGINGSWAIFMCQRRRTQSDRDMTTPIVYSHFSGALYPVDLLAEPSLENSFSVKSLVHICASYIIQDSTKTEQAAEMIPRELFIPLMQAALLASKDRAIEVLMMRWPYSSLCLRTLVPSLYKSTQPLCDVQYLTSIVKRSLKYTTCLAHTFSKCFKNPTCKLRHLDISGFPTAELMTNYLASQTMLLYSEIRQSTTVDLYNSAVTAMKRLLGSTDLQTIDAGVSLPDNTYTVKLDSCITSEDTFTELCKALKVSRFEGEKLSLLIDKIDATCIGQAGLVLLLKQVICENITGLRLKYNSLHCDDFGKLAPYISKLTNLTALDLSCNAIHLYQDDSCCDSMGEVLSCLTKLERLDLSNNRIKTRLRRVIQGITNPLKYLRLVGCGLTFTDITYLTISHHCRGLRELDLSENTLGPHHRAVGQLLQNAGNNLLALDLEDCAFRDEHMSYLLKDFPCLQSLLYLNIAQHFLTETTIFDVISKFSKLNSSVALKIPYPPEYFIFESQSMEELNRYKARAYLDMLHAANITRPDNRQPLKVYPKQSEFHATYL